MILTLCACATLDVCSEPALDAKGEAFIACLAKVQQGIGRHVGLLAEGFDESQETSYGAMKDAHVAAQQVELAERELLAARAELELEKSARQR